MIFNYIILSVLQKKKAYKFEHLSMFIFRLENRTRLEPKDIIFWKAVEHSLLENFVFPVQ